MVSSLNQLRWACRRGMLELDLILQSFVDRYYASLLSLQQQAFIKLLTYPDQELFDYLVGHQVIKDQSLVEIVDLIQSHHDQSYNGDAE